MKFLDAITEARFKRDASGNILFYPWGSFGSGYITKSEETREKARQCYTRLFIFGCVGGAVIVSVSDGDFVQILGWTLALGAISIGFQYLAMRSLTKDLPRAAEKLSYLESRKSSVNAHGLKQLVLVEIIAISFVAMGFWNAQDSDWELFDYTTIGLFGIGCVVIGYQIFIKLRAK